MRRALLLAISVAVFGFAPTNASPPNTPSAPVSSSGCSAPDGWSGILAHDPDFVVFGENHGTSEAPAMISELLCALAKKGESVLLAVEIASTHDTAWQSAWQQPHADFGAELIKHGWKGREDGVTSEAMLKLVLGAHKIKDEGAKIGIVAFNGTRDDDQRARFADLPGQGPHEAAQAENIANAAKLKEYDNVIVLVGSFHAVKTTTSLGGFPTEPMAKRLERYGSVLSLVMRSAGGSSWSCQASPGFKFVPGEPIPAGTIRCQSHPSKGQDDLGLPPFVALGAFPGREPSDRYDGYFWVGPTTSSPPVVVE